MSCTYGPRCRNSGGFTLVEMLIAIAIVGALAALAIPAVQQAREAARRTRCQNNLRQIGNALLSFESAHARLPAGRDAQNRRQHSWATAILPQLEQRDLHQRYDYSQAWNDAANESVAQANVALFRCPSATGKWNGKTDYG